MGCGSGRACVTKIAAPIPCCARSSPILTLPFRQPLPLARNVDRGLLCIRSVFAHNGSAVSALVFALQALIGRELIHITTHRAGNGKPVYAVYNPFHGAWIKYR